MKSFSVLLLFTFLSLPLLSPAQEKKPDQNIVEGKASLERIESVAKWQSLFNGKDLNEWQGDLEKHVVEEGILVCKKGAKILETKKQYSDFVFRFEFKLEESGNNGIGIRAPSGAQPAFEAIEIQILDHNGSKYMAETKDGKKISRLKPWQVHGSIYGVMPAKTGYLKPVGEWNEETIICIEDHLKVIVNGAVVVDAYLDDSSPIDGRPHPGLKFRSGHISLAGHSDRVEFRNLAVADFSPSPTKPASTAPNTPPSGFTSFFNGKDLTGWKGLAAKNANDRRALQGDDLAKAQSAADEIMNSHWSVIEGVLTYDGKGQSLCTARDYGDFEFYMDWKIPPGADSGIYLRGAPQVQIWDPWDPRTKDKSIPATSEDWVAAYRNGRNLGSGGLWNNRRHSNRPLTNADKKPGEWNTFLIRMVGDKVTIWLNDKLIVDRTVLENYWDKNDRASPLPRADQIEIQHHGSALFFKNLYIRELPY